MLSFSRSWTEGDGEAWSWEKVKGIGEDELFPTRRGTDYPSGKQIDTAQLSYEAQYLEVTGNTHLYGLFDFTLQKWRFINHTPDLTDKQALLDMLDKCDYLDDLIHKTCQHFPSMTASETEVRNALNQVDSLLKENPCPYFGHGVEKRTMPTIVVKDHLPAFTLALAVYFRLARSLRLVMAPISIRLEDGRSFGIAYSGNPIDLVEEEFQWCTNVIDI